MSVASVARERQVNAQKQLVELCPPGTTLHTVLRHTSRSGMSRSISVLYLPAPNRVYELDGLVAALLDEKIDPVHGGVKVRGAGMDMGFDLVYRVSMKIWGPGYDCTGEDCPSNSHVNDYNAPRGAGVHHTDGYAISQRWL